MSAPSKLNAVEFTQYAKKLQLLTEIVAELSEDGISIDLFGIPHADIIDDETCEGSKLYFSLTVPHFDEKTLARTDSDQPLHLSVERSDDYTGGKFEVFMAETYGRGIARSTKDVVEEILMHYTAGGKSAHLLDAPTRGEMSLFRRYNLVEEARTIYAVKKNNLQYS